MAAISMDLRKRIFEARESGETTAEVAERFSVCTSFVRRLMQRYRETGSLAVPVTGKKRGRKFAFSEQDLERLGNLVAEKPDWTPRELGEELGFDVKPLTVWRALRRLDLTYKKSQYFPQNKKGQMSKKPGKNGTKR
jgi:transposase